MSRPARIAALAVVTAGVLVSFYLWKSSPRSQPAPAPASSRGETTQAPADSSAHPVPAASIRGDGISDSDRKLLADLEQIFAAKNDNDPRLDTEFRNLTPETKRLLKQEYGKLPAESLNERGTIVFLIGRELKTPEDFAFLSQVGNQSPCLSLGDCKKEASASEESMHEEVAVSVTLTYPQRVALKSLENLLQQSQASQAQVAMALNALGSITESPVGWVAQKAAELQSRYTRH